MQFRANIKCQDVFALEKVRTAIKSVCVCVRERERERERERGKERKTCKKEREGGND